MDVLHDPSLQEFQDEVRTWLEPFFAGEHQLGARDLAELRRLVRHAERCRAWLGARPEVDLALAEQGRRLPEPAIKTRTGEPTDDPGELARGGSVMPVGGTGHGHKGHALTLMTEVLSQALAGYGRSQERAESELNSVYLQVLDPSAFTDPANYGREIAHLVRMVEEAPPDEPGRPVRMPGRRAWSTRAQQMASGVALEPGILEGLAPFAEAAGLQLPA